ncbi:MAG: methionine synthase [Acidiphilium sp. 37-64-53]|uniref:methionine synthase n=1 Tax=Acidiphilium TaxID=522 RepID=UPI000BDCA982|nr:MULTISPECIES: methionine synthase [Acidiphilium]OYW03664.1 MAG: methionine synthase [Acidiphilium sp. 37-64-53]OZB29759.1 MAG: methionine synthase [Acidiphilium sp. 34-64-41]HQT84235.1 methionine synthase [Acidiphilium rubrum]
MSKPHLLDALRHHVLLCDGGMGARVQALTLDVERDYWDKENCTEILNLSRPDLIREIHRSYFEAGADMVETNSFGGSPITLEEFQLGDRAFEINRIAAELAREAAETFADSRTRYVIGSVGPGTKLPSLGNIAYDPLEAGLAEQCRGLIAGGVDAILIETCQDTLQIKAAVNGAKIARAELKRDIPIFVQVTVETTGTLLVGPDIAAAATVIHALDIPLIGLNCATGPQEMAEHVRYLSQNWPGLISIQPNAGLPELVDGATHYPLGAAELASWMERFVLEDGINLVGGCCGTSIPHIEALNAMLTKLGNPRPTPVARKSYWVPSVASLYGATPLRQENSYFSIGERCNANGSKKWRELQENADWDGCVAMGREQVAEASNALDICTAFVGRDELYEMNEVITRFTSSVNAPLVIDSTETPVIEAALKLHGGKPIINSINFEDGEHIARERLTLAKKFGAAIIALTIDEVGMAKEPQQKLEIARRLVDVACNQYGLPQSDLLIDPLTLTIATGNEDDRKLGQWTLEGIKLIRDEFPDIQIILGLSNISFGLNPAARAVLNSVFLDLAVKAGMTGAIVHVSKIRPLHLISPEEIEVMEDLIFDRRREDYDPLKKVLAMFADRKAAQATKKTRAETVEGRLRDRIIDGDRKGLTDELDDALQHHQPLDIINNILLDGMKVVGELFGAGKMQLPFVLQSAETMKASVAYLEPKMERIAGQEKGTIVLATVKGDVHDIGKNLVDIILTNNGYRVVNLGIKVPLADMVAAAKEHRAHAIGMSGLLVKSTVVMRENLEEMARQGLEIPVLLGGAALTRNYVEDDCVAAYAGGRVAYARDAFDGLHLMDKVTGNAFDDYLAALQAKRKGKSRNTKRKLGEADTRGFAPVDVNAAQARRRRLTENLAVPTPPFWGARMIETPAKALVPFINERSLFQFQWGFRKQGKTLEEFLGWARQELRPIMKRMLALCEAENILKPQAIYGYWKAAGQGNDLILFEQDGTTEVARFTLPRQPREDGDCIADFFRDIEDPERDIIALQVVTMGQKSSEIARDWFEDNRYQDYLYLHGLSVEMAEAMAEHTHKRIRAECGFAAEDDRDIEKMLAQSYRGSRYSFGYPACPKLEDQTQLLRLLDAERIGVSLSDESQLHPEQSTSAIVVLNPKAKYFSV